MRLFSETTDILQAFAVVLVTADGTVTSRSIFMLDLFPWSYEDISLAAFDCQLFWNFREAIRVVDSTRWICVVSRVKSASFVWSPRNLATTAAFVARISAFRL